MRIYLVDAHEIIELENALIVAMTNDVVVVHSAEGPIYRADHVAWWREGDRVELETPGLWTLS